jgi:hypothetical protein
MTVEVGVQATDMSTLKNAEIGPVMKVFVHLITTVMKKGRNTLYWKVPDENLT